jgi:CMP-N-acetylneuraminic acid synthetase
MKPKIIAVIPARGGSTRIKNKNIKIFNKKPLVAWTIKAALQSKLIDDVYVTSENENILKLSKKYLAKIIKRPKKLSNSIIMPDEAIKHAYLEINKNYDYIVTLQPTSPLRTAKDIDGAVNKIIKTKADSLLSVFKTHAFLWKKSRNYYLPTNYDYNKRPRSQESELFQENGAIYITKPKILLKKNNRLGGKITTYCLSFWKSIDIDFLEDFHAAEVLQKNIKLKKYFNI